MPAGALPTSIVFTSCLVAGSMRDTVPSPAFATQTEPAPTATAAGCLPTGIWSVAFEPGSILVTMSSLSLVTQAAPCPKAIPVDRRPTLVESIGPFRNVGGL